MTKKTNRKWQFMNIETEVMQSEFEFNASIIQRQWERDSYLLRAAMEKSTRLYQICYQYRHLEQAEGLEKLATYYSECSNRCLDNQHIDEAVRYGDLYEKTIESAKIHRELAWK